MKRKSDTELADIQSKLPKNWSIHWSNTNSRYYYFNKLTNINTFDYPNVNKVSKPNETIPVVIPKVEKVEKVEKISPIKNIQTFNIASTTLSIDKTIKLPVKSEISKPLKLKTDNYDFTSNISLLKGNIVDKPEPANLSREYYRYHCIRYLRQYFENLNIELLAKNAVKESFNRWLYLQLALPSSLIKSDNNSNDVEKSLKSMFSSFPVSNENYNLNDPILRYPGVCVTTDVIKCELRAELVVRCDRTNFETYKPWKLRNIVNDYIKNMKSILDIWFGVTYNTYKNFDVRDIPSFLEKYIKQQTPVFRRLNELTKNNKTHVLNENISSLVQDSIESLIYVHKQNIDKSSLSELGNILLRVRDSCLPLLNELFEPRIEVICLMLKNETIFTLSELYNLKELKLTSSVIIKDSNADVMKETVQIQLIAEPYALNISELDTFMTPCINSIKSQNFNSPILLDSIHISKFHHDKLLTLFNLNSNLPVSQFSTYLYSLMRRYSTLQDSLDVTPFEICTLASSNNSDSKITREGTGFHAAAPEAVFRALFALGVAAENFASPLNCFLGKYCSAFYDIDYYFGSLGSFFNYCPTSGSYECNPPFTIEVMDCTALYLDTLLSASNEPLSFAVMVPNWNDPPAAYIKTFCESKYLRNKFVIPAKQHHYITGAQQSESEERYFDSIHDTLFYILQNEAGSIKWKVTNDLCENIKNRFSK